MRTIDPDTLAQTGAGARAGRPSALREILDVVRPIAVHRCRAELGPPLGVPGADAVAAEICRRVLERVAREPNRSVLALAADQAHSTISQELRSAGAETGAGTALSVLSAADRELLTLRVISGLTVEQTAEALESTPGRVRLDQHRALRRLRAA